MKPRRVAAVLSIVSGIILLFILANSPNAEDALTCTDSQCEQQGGQAGIDHQERIPAPSPQPSASATPVPTPAWPAASPWPSTSPSMSPTPYASPYGTPYGSDGPPTPGISPPGTAS